MDIIPASSVSQLSSGFPPPQPPFVASVPIPILHEFVTVIQKDYMKNLKMLTRL
jgi:hypothetical protein